MALKAEETAQYANPLPHVLMLTAIVVGVATLGTALALCQRIYQGYGTIEEDELLNKIERADAEGDLSPLEKVHPQEKVVEGAESRSPKNLPTLNLHGLRGIPPKNLPSQRANPPLRQKIRLG